MLLIISEEADYSTNVVIDWLLFYNIKFVRVNQEDVLVLKFIGDDITFSGNNIFFSMTEIESVWYRRGDINFLIEKADDKQIDNFRSHEIRKIKEYLHYKFSKIKHINNFLNSDVNKLVVSDIARAVGLKTPLDLLFSNKEELAKFNTFLKSTKSICGSTMFDFENHYAVGYTSLLDDLNIIPDSFFPSLVQDYIDKKYELRIFYLNEKLWSMAIFSQNDSMTNIDFRNYNKDIPNRNVPFKLPYEIEKKIIDLMKRMNLNCGSIDMLVNKKNEFFFLEINPIGQFGMVSNPCNYNLHKEIANFLK